MSIISLGYQLTKGGSVKKSIFSSSLKIILLLYTDKYVWKPEEYSVIADHVIQDISGHWPLLSTTPCLMGSVLYFIPSSCRPMWEIMTSPTSVCTHGHCYTTFRFTFTTNFYCSTVKQCCSTLLACDPSNPKSRPSSECTCLAVLALFCNDVLSVPRLVITGHSD